MNTNSFLRADEPTRRAFLGGMAKGLFGLSALPVLGGRALAGSNNLTPATARNVIYLYMSGGMSHVDTFDLKPGTDVQGPTESLRTNADGVLVSSHFQTLAKQMDKVCVINSMKSTQGAHSQGRYYAHTGYELRGTIQHPTMGAWLSHLAGGLNPTLPNHVEIGGGQYTATAGFLGPKHAPLPIGDPAAGLQNSKRNDAVDAKTFERRLARMREMNEEFARKHGEKGVGGYRDMYDEALRLMSSRDLAAFDITQEPQALRDAYGDSTLGQGALLARRLVEHGVRFVEVVSGGWDTHNDNFDELEELVPNLDRALGTLLADLDSRGLLEETLVVVTTEFGRTPTIVTDRMGRNHYPKAYSSLLAGGGVRGGTTWGKTDETGSNVIENPVTVPDFNATIAHALGLPLKDEIYSPSGRPFTVADKGVPVTEIFA